MKKVFLISGCLVVALQLFAQKVYDNNIIFKNGNPMQLTSTIGIESTVNSTKIDEKENNIEIKMQDATVVQITPNRTTINPVVIAPTIQAETGNIGNITANNITASNINAQTLEVDYKQLNNFYIKYLYSENHIGGVPSTYLAQHQDELGNPLWQFTFRNTPVQFWNFATNGSTAVGLRTSATGYFSHAEGTGVWRERDKVIDYTEDRVVMVNNAERLADINRIIGNDPKTEAIGFGSHAEGTCTRAIGDWSHSEGGCTMATNVHCHSEGVLTFALGEASHSEGAEWVYATGYGAHAEGIGTIASGVGAHAEGHCTIASADGSHALGRHCIASNNFAHVWSGSGNGYGSHGIGTYNINPKNGLDGYYIGEKTLGQIVEERVAEALNNLDAEDVINPTGVITAEFNKNYVFTKADNDPDTLEITFNSLKSRPNLVVVKGYTNVNFSFMENRNKKIAINVRETLGSRNDDNEPQVFEVFKAGGTPFVFKK